MAPTPGALLNRVRPRSCPAEERWSFSVGDIVADVVRAPDPVRGIVALLNHFGGVALSAQSVEFDGDDVDWSDVTEVRTRNLVGYLLSDAIDRQVGKLPLPWFPGRGLLLDAVGAAALTAIAAVAKQQLEDGPLDIRIPAEVHYRGVLHGKELTPGRACRARAGRPRRPRLPAGNGPHARRRRAVVRRRSDRCGGAPRRPHQVGDRQAHVISAEIAKREITPKSLLDGDEVVGVHGGAAHLGG